MTLKTIVIFVDGREETISDDYLDLHEAVAHAVTLADTHGNDPGDGSGPPDWICVKRGDDVQVKLKVMRGGLTGKGA